MQFIYTFLKNQKLASIYLARVSDCSCWWRLRWVQIKRIHSESKSRVLWIKKFREMANEGDFWNNLDSFVEKQTNGKEMEKVGDWLKSVPDPNSEKSQQKTKSKISTGWVVIGTNHLYESWKQHSKTFNFPLEEKKFSRAADDDVFCNNKNKLDGKFSRAQLEKL